jgi:hypothetical protein
MALSAKRKESGKSVSGGYQTIASLSAIVAKKQITAAPIIPKFLKSSTDFPVTIAPENSSYEATSYGNAITSL